MIDNTTLITSLFKKVRPNMSNLNRNKVAFLFLTLATNTAFGVAKDTIQGHIGGLSNQINRDIGDIPGNRYNGDLQFSYFNNRSLDLERKFEVSAMVNDQSLTMWSLQEAYVEKKGAFRPWDAAEKVGDKIKVGRQIIPWSTVDEAWGLGKLNNRKNFDFFNPGQEGLIGASYENRSSNGFFWKAFGSGVYAPEMNPGLDINKKNNTISSRNPWATAPAPSTNIDGNETPIQYIIDYPSISDVIYRYTIGASAGWENEHWAVDGFVVRKPENQLSTQVEVALAEDAASVKAFIKPQFYYHDVYGGNLKYRNGDVEVQFSGIAIRPNTFPDGNSEATKYTEIKTEKRREDYVGGGISRTNDKFGMGFNYVARLSPFDRERDSLAQDPRWNQAVNAFLMRNFTKTVQVSGDVKYDMLTTDRLIMLRAGYKVSKELLTTFGVNMIGTPTNGKSFWSPYTNNDAVFGGIRYIF
jgi:hypothetical protein